MKNRLWILILSIFATCFVLGGCSDAREGSSSDFSSKQEAAWEDEAIEDQEHGEIELPEIERQ